MSHLIKEKPSILYVDDRVNNLHSFKATFRREYNVFIAESPSEAIKILAENTVQVAISDYKMPDISGVTFLEIVKNNYPDTIRIMLTGHADLPAVVEAINRSQIFRFLAKPWSEPELRKGIESAVNLYFTQHQIQHKNQELEKAYRELDRLVFSTAHDITGPLSNILGLIDIIKTEPENSEEYLHLIERSTKKLQFIARDALSFHRNKRTGINVVEVNMEKEISESINSHKFFQNTGDLKFELNVSSETPFYSDKTRIRFLLNNLISNAIKYQDLSKENNWVRIDFSCNKEEAILKVEDNGVGIEAEILPRIFDIYYRASNQSTGAGIGLYVATEAAEMLSGSIEANSKKGEGSLFTTVLPNNIPDN